MGRRVILFEKWARKNGEDVQGRKTLDRCEGAAEEMTIGWKRRQCQGRGDDSLVSLDRYNQCKGW